MPHTYAIINKVTSGYRVSFGPRYRYDETFEKFDDAYRSGARHVNWDYNFVTVHIYPPEIQEIMDEIQRDREEQERLALENKEKEELRKLKAKYPDE